MLFFGSGGNLDILIDEQFIGRFLTNNIMSNKIIKITKTARNQTYSYCPCLLVRHRCFAQTRLHFCLLVSSVSCVNAKQKKQLQLYTYASPCFSVTACPGRPICPGAVVPVS